MQNLLRIGTGLAFVLAIVSVNLWLELRSERALTAELQAQVAETTNAPVVHTPAQRAEAQAVAATTPTRNASGNAGPAQPGSAQDIAANLPTRNAFSPANNLMQDPEYRKALFMQARMQLKRTYTDVAEELGLTEREAEQLFDILAERQVGGNLSANLGADGRQDQQAMQDAIRMRNETQRRLEESLQALLGPARQPKWQEYQLSLSARSRATSMSGMLATSGYPLTEAQRRPLTTALIAEEKYVRDTQPTGRQSMPMNMESAARQQEEAVTRQEESNRRYLEVAAAHMTSKQLSLVKEVLDQQIAMSRAAARLQRERAESRRSEPAAENVFIRN